MMLFDCNLVDLCHQIYSCSSKALKMYLSLLIFQPKQTDTSFQVSQNQKSIQSLGINQLYKICILTQQMFRFSGNKTNSTEAGFDTPVKNEPNKHIQLSTAHQSYEKSNQKSIQSNQSIQLSNKNMNIFKKRKYTKMIKKSNLKLLARQASKLQDMKVNSETCSDVVKQSYKNQLDKTYVVIGRISKVHEEKKYYVIYCEDESFKQVKFYFTKHVPNENSNKHVSKPNYKTSKKKIMNLDSLEFQPKVGQGTPYFKFLVIFREIPIFEKGQNQVLNSDYDPEDTDGEQNHNRKRYSPIIKSTQFRIYVESFEKIHNFNYIVFHNMHIYFEQVYQERVTSKKIEFLDNI